MEEGLVSLLGVLGMFLAKLCERRGVMCTSMGILWSCSVERHSVRVLFGEEGDS
jgi:hypothetical protein